MKNIQRSFTVGAGSQGTLYSLPALAESGYPNITRMPISLRIVLESLVRNCDELKVTKQDVENLAAWNAKNPGQYEIPFTVGRIILQDLTGVPLLVDLAAMRAAVADRGADPAKMEPLVPVDLVVDHSVQVDWSGFPAAYQQNLTREFERNTERYEFLKWGQQAFETFSVVPPSTGIVHQVNLEYLASGVLENKGVYYPDSLVGTDSHTTMINGLGIVAWGVGGIEAEAGMLGQPVTFLVPEVVGVELIGELAEGVTATDLALRVTELLRAQGVVGKFVEFFGTGAKSLTLADRATVANMAPEYGATMGFFPIDEESVAYLRETGRSEELLTTYENYYREQQMFGMPMKGDIDYSLELQLDLASIVPSVAGPKRPQDRIALSELKSDFQGRMTTDIYGLEQGRPAVPVCMKGDAGNPEAATQHDIELRDGSILVAAITSCTNTSNEGLMLAAGLVAKKAAALGMKVPAYVKTSMAPGSRIAAKYFENNELSDALDSIGFATVGYGCTTCIGNSGPLNPELEEAVKQHDLLSCSVLSGNRNFEARIHASVKANFLMSPPLVIAFALAGRVDIDMATEAIGTSAEGKPVFLSDIWPSSAEIAAARTKACQPADYDACYSQTVPEWAGVAAPQGATFEWNNDSTYIHRPPFFEEFTGEKNDICDISNARPLGIFGDSVTTDHISPAGAIKPTGPAGQFLAAQGVERRDFNTFGSRRGNDLIMTRGTFANVRIKNRMVGSQEGGYTLYYGNESVSPADVEITAPAGAKATFIYDAGMAYKASQTPTIIIAGEDYGMGSSRDWAAKGTRLLGVSAVITKSFERIHRSNLIGMGVLPLNFEYADDYERVKDLTDATFSIIGLNNEMAPRSRASLIVTPAQGNQFTLPLIVRIDTPIEKEYFRAGGILPYVLTQYC